MKFSVREAARLNLSDQPVFDGVELVVTPRLLRQVTDRTYALMDKASSEQEIDASIDALIAQLEQLRGEAKELLRAKQPKPRKPA